MTIKATCMFMWISILTVSAQNISIHGVVSDNYKELLAGVTVGVRGTTIGTSTDANGEFILAVPSDTSVLQIRFIGFKPQEIVVGNQRVFSITMQEETTELDEVVVVAFGKQRKQSVTSSITAVNTKNLRVPASNFTTALAGNVAGIISFQSTGEPGADNAEYFVRGVTSFGYSKAPLILIDGFESTGDDLARLQIDDIESFSVLKDASAAVMYGARSANGIITITTKGGQEGRNKVSFRFDANYSTPTQKIEFLDGVPYMRLYNEAQMTRNPLLPPFYDEQKIQMTARGGNPMIYPNVNWYDVMFSPGTWNEKANLNISGGGAVANYYIAAGLDHETGLLKVDKRNNFNDNINIIRTHLRSNVLFKLSKSTTLDTRITGRFERYTGPYEKPSNLFRAIMYSNPVDFPPVYEPDAANADKEHILFGSTLISGQGGKINPYAEMVRGYEDRNEAYIVAQATLNQDLGFITPGLKLSLKAGADTYSKYSSRRTYNPYYYQLQSYNQATGEYTLFALNATTGQSYLGDVNPDRDAGFKDYFEGILSWNNSFKDLHNLGATLVGSATENLYGGGSQSIYETLPEKNLVVAGRATYNYGERYFAEFSFGYNGSEKFTGDKIYGFFPAYSGAWLMSNEAFYESMKSFMPMLKLKASYGKSGNDAIGRRDERFKFLSQIFLPDNISPLGDGGNGYRWGKDFTNSYGGYTILRYANPEITWEASTKSNLGLEFSLLRREVINVQFDIFKERRTQIYWSRDNFPASAGLAAGLAGNVGIVDAEGCDGQLQIENQFNKNFWMQGRANFTYGRNKIVEIDEKMFPDEYLRRKGYPTEQRWGLIAERLFVDEAEIVNSPRQDFGEYMAGDIKYKDVNGDGVINNNDRVAMGYPTTPEIQYGYGLSMGYKNFDFSFFFQGNARVSIFINPGVGGDDGNEGIAPFYMYRNAMPIIARDYWSETAPNPHAFWPRLSTEPISNNLQQSSWWMRNGSFMRLKNVELGYNYRNKKLIAENMRLYLTVENAFVISAFKLWDPEMGTKGIAYPPNRRFNVGIKLDF